MPGSNVTVDQTYHNKLDVSVADSEVLPTFRKHQRKPTNEEVHQAEESALRRAKDAVAFLQSAGNPKAHIVQSAADKLVQDIDRARNFRACWEVAAVIDESTIGVFGDGESAFSNVAEVNTVAVESRDLRAFENKLLSELRGLGSNLAQTAHGKEIGGAARKYCEALALMRGQSVPVVEKESGVAKSPDLKKLWKVLLEELKREAQWFERQESRLYGGPVAKGVAAHLMSAYQKFEAALRMVPGINIPAPTRSKSAERSRPKSASAKPAPAPKPAPAQDRAKSASPASAPKPQSAKPMNSSAPAPAGAKASASPSPAPTPSSRPVTAQPVKQGAAPPTQQAQKTSEPQKQPAAAPKPQQQPVAQPQKQPAATPKPQQPAAQPQPQKQQQSSAPKPQSQPAGSMPSQQPAQSDRGRSAGSKAPASAPMPASNTTTPASSRPVSAQPQPAKQSAQSKHAAPAQPQQQQQQQLAPPESSKKDRARSASPKPQQQQQQPQASASTPAPKPEAASRPSSSQPKEKSGAPKATQPVAAPPAAAPNEHAQKGGKKGKKN
ncbi:hypothetical protein M427DRAFT_475031 [Gonapodya prolifera JEL478]|uniref:Uncharacterized protein n=1 Tax=Gonapodya prolifera (strain JEL478) TaxID=1344416 RepID=A0A139A184_GONPJ|nr:hypothetical protein M427DRAFT_475031 [Gonapodya prolifera JEL478]|eukprot:KXS10531.1 hypothetical protein M427DRAFT_475031 [Gonapodya prolifera JEL478]